MNTSPETHDLSLPDWGPYSKRFFGISHIPDHDSGDRFDLTVIPGIYRRQFGVPDALRPSNYLPWEVSPDLEAYSYRQVLEWKERLYCDISFFPIDSHTRQIRCSFVNRTDWGFDCALHFIAAFVPEPSGRLAHDADCWLRPVMESESDLEPDCTFPGECRMPGTAAGSAYRIEPGRPFRFDLPENAGQNIFLRARIDGKAVLTLNGRQFELEGNDSWQLYPIDLAGERHPVFVSGSAFLADGLAATRKSTVVLQDMPKDITPEIRYSSGDCIIWKYAGCSRYYGLRLNRKYCFSRAYSVENFNDTLLYKDFLHQPFLTNAGQQGGPDRILDTAIQPLCVPANGELVLHAAIADGESPDELKERLAHVLDQPEETDRKGMDSFLKSSCSPWDFGLARMRSVVLSNVVYPTYFAGKFVRHHTPGRMWNSLYTWDSGFIGLGLLEISRERAVENLNAYLTAPGDPDNAFVHHGSPVPMQIYLYYELWNRFGDRTLLKEFYPRVKQYYDFLAGHNPKSRTRSLCREAQSATWMYFYNSGGWDDYPPQVAVHADGLTASAVPVVGTSHLIRCAKMLRAAARELGLPTESYTQDIQAFSAALQQYSWDPEEGYFSYTLHDKNGNCTGFLRHESGRNFNMGLDGLMPLAAGIVSGEQAEIMWEHLENPERCWTSSGISTVDRTAPYYRNDGYWNGSVWMPYQWFFWKAALDAGKADFAWKIAETALSLWNRETAASLACYEQFSVSSGRGSGWHHFSGLSSPVLSWGAAYSSPGVVTAGFDVFRKNMTVSETSFRADLEIEGNAGDITTLIAVLDREQIRAFYAGKELPVRCRREHVFEVDLPKNSVGELILQ